MKLFSCPSVVQAAAVLIIAGAFGVCALNAEEKQIRVNLGTLAPTGSSYHQSLQAMGEQWRGQGVKLVVYPDGRQGGEADMVRLMRVGTLHAGFLSAVGLSDIEPSVTGLQDLPMMFRSLAEVDYVNERLHPELEKRLVKKGFVVLFWSDAGWVHYFSKKEMLMPGDLKKMKLFTWAGNPNEVKIWKEAGFNAVPLETDQVLPGLQTGLIDCVASPPVFALAGQLDTSAPHMLALNWAPLVGAAVIKKEVWDRLPASSQQVLLKAAAEAGRQIKERSRKESEEAIVAMKKRKLTVHPVTAEMEMAWRKIAEEVYPKIRGTVVPADIFDQVQKLLVEYRAQGSGGGKKPE